MTKILLKLDDLHAQNFPSQLHFAVIKGDIDKVKLLLEDPVFKKTVAQYNNYLLVMAGSNNHLSLVEILLLLPEVKAALNNTDFAGAISGTHVGIVERFLKEETFSQNEEELKEVLAKLNRPDFKNKLQANELENSNIIREKIELALKACELLNQNTTALIFSDISPSSKKIGIIPDYLKLDDAREKRKRPAPGFYAQT